MELNAMLMVLEIDTASNDQVRIQRIFDSKSCHLLYCEMERNLMFWNEYETKSIELPDKFHLTTISN